MGRRRAALEEPTLALARSLASSGLPAHAARLTEFVPEGDIGSDSHRAPLRAALDDLAAEVDLSERQRDEAHRLATVAAARQPRGCGLSGASAGSDGIQTKAASRYRPTQEPSREVKDRPRGGRRSRRRWPDPYSAAETARSAAATTSSGGRVSSIWTTSVSSGEGGSNVASCESSMSACM